MNETLIASLQQRVNLTQRSDYKLGGKYDRFEALVLDCGRLMEPEIENPSPEFGLPKNCYWNSQKLASYRSHFIYCEGYALAESVNFPVPHAWVLNSEGKVLETTWESPGLAYLGVPFSWVWVQSLLSQRRQKGRDNNLSVFECNHLEKYSLLKEGLPSEAYQEISSCR